MILSIALLSENIINPLNTNVGSVATSSVDEIGSVEANAATSTGTICLGSWVSSRWSEKQYNWLAWKFRYVYKYKVTYKMKNLKTRSIYYTYSTNINGYSAWLRI
ncbi:MAG: hypothetical protein ACRC1M_07580 [Methanobacteriaceae archaeon]